MVEGADGCFYVGRSVAERNEDVICARRSRVGKRSRDDGRGDWGAEVLALEGCDAGLEDADGADDLVDCVADGRGWSWGRGQGSRLGFKRGEAAEDGRDGRVERKEGGIGTRMAESALASVNEESMGGFMLGE